MRGSGYILLYIQYRQRPCQSVTEAVILASDLRNLMAGPIIQSIYIYLENYLVNTRSFIQIMNYPLGNGDGVQWNTRGFELLNCRLV